jgi:hypothetical protein
MPSSTILVSSFFDGSAMLRTPFQLTPACK